jgi:hypothetical protein
VSARLGHGSIRTTFSVANLCPKKVFSEHLDGAEAGWFVVSIRRFQSKTNDVRDQHDQRRRIVIKFDLSEHYCLRHDWFTA